MENNLNNQHKNDHYVYFLIDNNYKIRYIGHGRGSRKDRTDIGARGKEFVDILNNGGSIEVYADELTKIEAMHLEANLLQPLMNGKYNLLINKSQGSYCVPYDPNYFKHFVEYSEDSKTFLKWVKGTKREGRDAGSIDKHSNYGQVRINGKLFYNHRVIYCLLNDVVLYSDLVINHIDGNRSNNNISNLELVSYKENSLKNLNRKPGNSGVVGITRLFERGKEMIMTTVVLRDGTKKSKRMNIIESKYEEQVQTLLDWKRNMLIAEYGFCPEHYKETYE